MTATVSDRDNSTVDEPSEIERAVLITAVNSAIGATILSRGPESCVCRVLARNGGWYAVKILSAARAQEAASIAERISGIAGTVPLVSWGIVAEHGYLVYEYIQRTVADLVEQLDRSDPEAIVASLDALRPVANALEALAERGLSHGDVKPSNIVLREGDGALIDLDQITGLGEPTTRYTPGFCSPQQLEGVLASEGDDRFGFAATVATIMVGGTSWMTNPPLVLDRELPKDTAAVLVEALDSDQSRRPAPTELLGRLLPSRPTVSGPSADAGRGTGGPSEEGRPHSVFAPPPQAELGQLDLTPSSDSAPQILPGAPKGGLLWADLSRKPLDDLMASGKEVWGEVSLRAETIDRLALESDRPEEEMEAAERSMWRSPAVITSIVIGALAVVALVAYLLLWR